MNFSSLNPSPPTDCEERKKFLRYTFCSLIKILLNSFSFTERSFLTAINREARKVKQQSEKKSWKQKKITTLTRIINFYRAMPLVVSPEFYVGVLHTTKKCWYVEFTRHSSAVLWEIKIERKFSLSHFFFTFFDIYKYFIIWPQEEDLFSAVFPTLK